MQINVVTQHQHLNDLLKQHHNLNSTSDLLKQKVIIKKKLYLLNLLLLSGSKFSNFCIRQYDSVRINSVLHSKSCVIFLKIIFFDLWGYILSYFFYHKSEVNYNNRALISLDPLVLL